MQVSERERYKAILVAKWQELARVGYDRKVLAVESAPEAEEQTALDLQRELVVFSLDHRTRLMWEVKSALVRIEEGSYGVCENCEEAIKPQRLAALPWTRFCVYCQEMSEHTLRRDGVRPEFPASLAA